MAANQNDPPALYTGTVALTGSANLTTFHAMPAINLGEVVMDWGSRRLFNLHGYTLPSHRSRIRRRRAHAAGACYPMDSSLEDVLTLLLTNATELNRMAAVATRERRETIRVVDLISRRVARLERDLRRLERRSLAN